MDEIKIEKNIPFPAGVAPLPRIDWSNTEIGDSFVVDGKKERARVRTSFLNYRDSKKCHFPPRTVLVSRAIENDQYRFWLMQNG
jgi:hypothetical protein